MKRQRIHILSSILMLHSSLVSVSALAQTAPLAPVPVASASPIASSANGTPVVNIAAPNEAGISHNKYQSYDVDARGLILNNSAENLVSIIGGGTAANANLRAGQAANLIINEVVVPNAGSQLRGYQEILGPSAQLVIANPWGITCDGCGFVNTPRVTLTTGTPNFGNGGALTGFTITGGQIAVKGDGLDASRASVLDLVARSVKIDGNVFVGNAAENRSGTLGVAGGGGLFNYASRQITGAAGSGPAPEFAIDTGLLGGMYADRIALIVNETGAGVRNAGNMAALAEDLTITANGKIAITGSLSSNRDLALTAGSIAIAQADPAKGIVFAGRSLLATASNTIDLGNGDLGARASVAIQANSLIDSGAGNRFVLDGGRISATADIMNLQAAWVAPQIDLSGGAITVGKDGVVFATGKTGTALTIAAARSLTLNEGFVGSVADVRIVTGALLLDGKSVLTTSGALDIDLASLDNSGTIKASGSVDIGTATSRAPTRITNRLSGQIFSEKNASVGNGLTGSSLTNVGIVAAGQKLTIDTAQTDNSGTIQATQLALNSAALDNTGKDALIYAAGKNAGDARIAATRISNEGTIWSDSDLTLNPLILDQRMAAGATDNALIGAKSDLIINFSGVAGLAGGNLQAGRDLMITGTRGFDVGANTDLRIAGRDATFSTTAGNHLEIAGGGWFASRNLTLIGDNLRIGGYTNSAGFLVDVPDVVVTGGTGGTGLVTLAARTGSIDMRPGSTAQSGADLLYTQSGALTFEAGRTLLANGNLTVTVPGFIDNAGTIAGGVLAFTPRDGNPLSLVNRAGGILNGARGLIIGTQAAPAVIVLNDATGQTDADAKLGTVATRGIISGGGFQIFTQQFLNRGLIVADSGNSLIDTPFFTNASEVATRSTGFNGTVLSFTDPKNIGALTIETNIFRNFGLFAGTGSTNINAADFVNEAGAGLSAFDLRVNEGLPRYAPGTPLIVINRGDIFGGNVYLGGAIIRNGNDLAIAANRTNIATIYAANDLTLFTLGTITNFNEIGAGRNVTISGSGSFSNTRSDLIRGGFCAAPGVGVSTCFSKIPSGSVILKGNLGFAGKSDGFIYDVDGLFQYALATGPFNTSGQPTEVWFDSASQIFTTEIVTDDSVKFRPVVFAGANLNINGFTTTINQGGALGAANNVTIDVTGGTLANQSFGLTNRTFEINRKTVKTMCDLGGLGTGPVGCNIVHDSIITPFNLPDRIVSDTQIGGSGLNATIFAGNTLRIIGAGGIVNNIGATAIAAPTASFTAAPGITVLPPTTPGLAPGATGLVIGGAQLVLPNSPNGRFVTTQTTKTGPLIESNPAFGIDSPALGSEYLVKLLGLNPDQQTRRLGDDNYEAYLITSQVRAQTNKSILNSFADSYSMTAALFDNAKTEQAALALTFGTALTADQVSKLKTDIVWMVEQEVKGQKVLVPVVYLSDATRASVVGGSSIEGYNVDIATQSVTNKGGNIVALNLARINTTGNIENLSGRIAGNNVLLDAKGDIINQTLTTRLGDAANGNDIAGRVASIDATNTAVLKAGGDVKISGAWVIAGKDANLIAGRNVEIGGLVLTNNGSNSSGAVTQTQSAVGAGVIANNNVIIDAEQDVVTRGAILQAGAGLAPDKPLPMSGDEYCSKNTCANGISDQMNAARQTEIDRRDAEFAANPKGVLGISAGRTVDIGTLALNDTDNRQSSRVQTYDTHSGDANSMQLAMGTGVEQRNESSTTVTTRGIGSALSGNRVQIGTKTGDVLITGSDISSGSAGTIIDSGRDVKIGAFIGGTSTASQSSVDRQGYELRGNADGVSSGLVASGSDSSDTANDQTARVSTLDSAGRLTIRAKKDIVNEGTQYNADGTIAFIGETLTNKAVAQTRSSTSNSSDYSASAMLGMNAGGTGSSIDNVRRTVNNKNAGGGQTPPKPEDGAPMVGNLAGDPNQKSMEGQFTVGNPEVSLTISGSGSNRNESRSATNVTTTNINSRGNVIYQTTGKATDVGTQVKAGQSIIIDAGSYENLAAANTTSSEFSTNSGSADVKGSINATAEVGLDVSAAGSGSRGKSDTSKAVVGTLKAGGGVSIKTRDGGITLEGTQIAAGARGVSLDAKTNLNLNQANDTIANSGSGESGTARGGGRVSLMGAGGSVSAGASGRSYSFDEQNNKAKTVDIKSGGGVTLRAGNDINAQGANVDAKGSVVLDATRDINWLAAQSQKRVTGQSDGGGTDITVGAGAEMATGSVGGTVSYERNRVDFTKTDRTGGTITSGGNVSITAGRNADFEGTKIDADSAQVNVAGNFTMRSAQSTIVENTSLDSGRIEAAGSKGGGMSGANTGSQAAGGGNTLGGNVGINHGHSNQNVLTNSNASITTKQGVALKVGGDATLAGANINAGAGVQGTIGGNLNIETRTDRAIVDQVSNNTYVGVAPVGKPGGSGAAKGMDIAQGAGNTAGQTGLYVNDSRSTKNNQTVGTASGINGGVGGINVTVGGNTTLTGAMNRGSDFDTKGTTTIGTVTTFVNETSKDTKITGTIASAAGADQGRGGDFNFNPNLEAAASRPRVPVPGVANDGPNVPLVRPIGGNGDRDPGIAPPPARARPDGNGLADNVPNVPGRRIGEGNGAPNAPVLPRVGNSGDNARQANLPVVPPRNVPAAPDGQQLALLNQPNLPNANRNRAPSNGADEVPYSNEPVQPPNGQGLNRNRAPSNGADEVPYSNEPVQPPGGQGLNRNRAPSNGDDLVPYSNEPNNNQPPRIVDGNNGLPKPNDGLQPGALNVQPNQGLILNQPSNENVVARGPLDLRVVDEARIKAFAGEGPQGKRQVRDITNLVFEIEFFRRPQPDGVDRSALADLTLSKLNDSLDGILRDADGKETWPINYMYVGEDDHVNFTRGLSKKVGEEVIRSFNNVVYLTPEQQARQRIEFTGDNKIQLVSGDRNGGELLAVTKIFAVLPDGRIIAGDGEFGVMQHSSLAAGKRVQMAGEMTLDASGRVTEITNQSGHYRVDGAGFLAWVARSLVPDGLVNENTVLRFVNEDAFKDAEHPDGKWRLGEPKIQGLLKDMGPLAPNDVSAKGQVVANVPNGIRSRQGSVDQIQNANANVPRIGGLGPDVVIPGVAAIPVASSGNYLGQEIARPNLNRNRAQTDDQGGFDLGQPQALARAAEVPLDVQAQSLVDNRKKGFKGRFDDEINNPFNEINAFRGNNPALGDALLVKFIGAMNGPKVENGVEIFPIQPKYVGENVDGLPHWELQGSSEPTQVRYFTQQERDSSAVKVENGRLRFTEGLRALPVGKELIFVVDRAGRMIVNTPEDGKIHHSSLAAGDPVRLAGTLQVDKNGRITAIANDSGHYRPTDNAFALWLRDNGAALPGADKMTVTMKGGDANFKSAQPLGLADVLVRGPGGRPLATILPPEITSALRVGKPSEFTGKALDAEARSAVGAIDQFETRDPAVKRRLFSELETSIKGPKLDPEGWTLFPLGIKYVGEDEVGFSSWLRRESPGEARSESPNVRYLSVEEQRNRRADIKDGKLVRDDGTPLVGQGRPQNLIFVIDASGNLIVDLPVDGQLHHSSLSGGKPVRMAGELHFDSSGTLDRITNTSGHFRPDDVALVRAVMLLKQKGLNVDDVLVYPARPGVNIAQQYGIEATNNAALLNLLPVQKRTRIEKLRDTVGGVFDTVKAKASNLRERIAPTNPVDLPEAPGAMPLGDANPIVAPPNRLQRLKTEVGNVVDTAKGKLAGLRDRVLPKRAEIVTAVVVPQSQLLAPALPTRALDLTPVTKQDIADYAKSRGLNDEAIRLSETVFDDVVRLRGEGKNMLADATLDQLNNSLKGAQVEPSGLKSFALLPQFIGEGDHVNFTRDLLFAGPNETTIKSTNKVVYFSPEEQANKTLVLSSLNDGGSMPKNGEGSLLDNRRGLFVVLTDGRIIFDAPESGVTHHSSLAAGQRVLMAGEIEFGANGIEHISNRSGHYRVDDASFIDWVSKTLVPAKLVSDYVVLQMSGGTIPALLNADGKNQILPLNSDIMQNYIRSRAQNGNNAADQVGIKPLGNNHYDSAVPPVAAKTGPVFGELYPRGEAAIPESANLPKPLLPVANDNGGRAESSESNPAASPLHHRR